MRRLIIVATASAVLLAASACASSGEPAPPSSTDSDDDLVAAAQAEGSLTWYNGAPPAVAEALGAAFEEEYGIRVDNQRLTSADIAQRFESEVAAENVQADLLYTIDPDFFQAMGDAGSTVQLEDEDVGDLPDEFRSDSYAVVVITPVAVHYNTEILGEDGIESWDDLLQPKLDGTLVLADPRASNAWAQFWSIVLHDDGLGPDYLERIADQHFQLVASGTPGLELVTAGEGAAVIGGIISGIDAGVANGAPLANWVPSNPGMGFYNYLAIATDAPHPNAARLFFRWLFSEEGSATFAELQKGSSPLGDLPGTVPLPDGMMEPPDSGQVDEDLPQVLELLGIE